jgi:hypothetical protein
MKKALCLLIMLTVVSFTPGLCQEEKAKEEKPEEEITVLEELKDPQNERRSIGWTVSKRRSEASLEREHRKEQEEAYSRVKKERQNKIRRLRGGN